MTAAGPGNNIAEPGRFLGPNRALAQLTLAAKNDDSRWGGPETIHRLSSASAKETSANIRCGTERESDQLATWPGRVYSSTDVIPTCPQDCRDRQRVPGNGACGYRGV